MQRLSQKAKSLLDFDERESAVRSSRERAILREDALLASIQYSSLMEGDQLAGAPLDLAAQIRGEGLLKAYVIVKSSAACTSAPYSLESVLLAHASWLDATASCADRRSAFPALSLISGKSGVLRSRDVVVGKHVAPEPGVIRSMIKRAEDSSRWLNSKPDKLIALLAHHHRFLWIHPFEDGNGRIARMLLETGMEGLGLSGMWSMSKALSRHQDEFYRLLSQADQPRRGDLDGRGNLTHSGLVSLIDFMIDCATEAAADALGSSVS
ncbi:Fic family protein [Pseudomonas syringae pv. actinidiae]|nr:Fic family protein [Pseudomonas syringae pv. actinidiae]